MRDDSVFKAASGLHGGIGGMKDVCGALLGASLMLGLMYGRSPEEAADPEKKDDAKQMVSQLYKWFKKEFGSVKCRIIRTKFEREVNNDTDIRGLAEKERLAKQHAKCADLAGRTAARTAEMLWDT